MDMTTDVEVYFKDGCGRCDKGETDECKARVWSSVLTALRTILRATELQEDCKWGAPIYTLAGKNVLSLSAFNAHVRIGFFKGALLADPENLLERPGPNSHVSRDMRFKTVGDVKARKAILLAYIEEAIANERAGKQVPPKPVDDYDMPEELIQALDEDPAFAEAFEALTPGRKKSYIIHIGGAKQAKTRASRVEKCMPKVYSGLGFNEYAR
jgi:uncharacterized protein YdeI (YjbR/CyaY-like superfamily)